MKAPRSLGHNVPVSVCTGGVWTKQEVTLSWSEDMPMEIRIKMWEPAAIDGCLAAPVWLLSRDVLSKTLLDAAWIGPMDGARVFLVGGSHRTVMTDSTERVSLTFETPALAAFVRSSLAMCPTESEALDVDGLITQIFHAEEAQ